MYIKVSDSASFLSMDVSVTPDTEIRKLPSGHLYELAQILEQQKQWEVLMCEIRLDCFNLDDDRFKYNYNHVNLINSASMQYHRPCAEIFLEEWGTSGRKRPTVNLLQQYLEKTNLWRAADYVAEKLLNEPRPERPKKGPSRNVVVESIPHSGPSSDLFVHHNKTEIVNDGNKENLSGIIPLNKKTIVADFEKNNGESNTSQLSSLDSTINRRLIAMDISVPKIPFDKLKTATESFAIKLGSGAFGTVYYGTCDGKEIAVKLLNDIAVEHFEQELLILTQHVDHLNLLPPLAVSDDVSLCLVYKYMCNRSLEDRLTDKVSMSPLSWQKRLSISHDITEGLQYLHSLPKPVVHRDIKSSNILLDVGDVAKIGDFGLIRVKKSLLTTVTNTVQGTPAYMPPESMHGRISPKMDVFCFGMILLELLTGLPVIDESREDQHLMYHVDNVVCDEGSITTLLDTKAGEWDTEIANGLHEVSSRCLVYDFKQRADTAEVSAKLRELKEKVATA